MLDEMFFCLLYSGSSGNSILILYKDILIIVDVGVSFKKFVQVFEKIGFNKKIDVILFFYDYYDYVKCVGVYFRKFNVFIIINYKIWESIKNFFGKVDESYVKLIDIGISFLVGSIGIGIFLIFYDVFDLMGFCFYVKDKKVLICIDVGYVSDSVAVMIDFLDIILFELNYDVEMLMFGLYLYYFKQRIKGDKGYFLNEQAVKMILKLNFVCIKRIYLGYLSEENNYLDVVFLIVSLILKQYGVFESYNFFFEIVNRYSLLFCFLL